MNAYGIVLFVHLAALLAAIGTSALAHFSEARLRVVETVVAARPWAALVDRAEKVFPAALVVLVASGSYLVQHGWTWTTAWIDTGLVGVGLLAANGALVIGGRNRALHRRLAEADEGSLPPSVVHLTRGHVGGVASWANTGLAIGIVFVMATKPGVAGCIAALAVAALTGVAVGLRLRAGK